MFIFILTLLIVSICAAAISESVFLRFKADDYFENKKTAHVFHFLLAAIAGFAAMYYALWDYQLAASHDSRAFQYVGYFISLPAGILTYVVCNLFYEFFRYVRGA
ncbi:hypothetical protein [Pseudovibrio sp. SCP19]|uniref:hypothetical protein n=1 Tax=Pseudovibrio sp. SCP19 TaxID=3141374 RepID=UPI00333BA43D